MRLFIAEKPSLAKAIAANLGSRSGGGDGFIEVGNDVVTWCFGHMLENEPPESYDSKWKSWDVRSLPIIVRDWKMRPKTKTEKGVTKVDPWVKKQLKTIEDLLKKAKVVVNAGDPDREGQLLVDEVLDYYGWKGQTQRLLLNATDALSVKKAIASMRQNAEFKNLSAAALCRSRADWLVGMNMSRAATKTYGQDKEVISVGRVQTPTLALVVRRDLEIENFKPQTFYTLTANTKTKFGDLALEHAPKENRILDKKVAQDLAQALRGKTIPLSVVQKQKKVGAPMPFMLATFQKVAESDLGLGANAALQMLQALYEAKVTSYPRTDHERLPPEQAASATKIASDVISFGVLDGMVKDTGKTVLPLLSPSKRVYSLPKEAEHHGIVPTGVSPANLNAAQMKAYKIICQRFIQSLMPDYLYEETVVSFDKDGRVFSQTGEVPLNAHESWRLLEPPAKVKTLTLSGKPSEGAVEDVEIKTGKTTPPLRYTEASLIADMRSIAKFVQDPKLKARLKETSGIGTAATQASTIETLKNRNFVKIQAKKLISTEFGRRVIEKLPPQLSDPGITAAWEDALSLIAEGKYQSSDFMQRADMYVQNQLNRILKKG